jgi:hypothetical protein
MALFFDWMLNRNTATLLRLRLLEHAQGFNPGDYNAVFDAELQKLLNRMADSEARQQVAELRGFDWANYIVRSLQRAGFRDDDAQQEAFQQIVVKLLVKPGRLFAGWEPHRHGPLQRRFQAATWNAIRNIAEKSRNRRRWMHNADPTVMAGQFAGKTPHNNIYIVDEFRGLVGRKLGKLALAILDTRLEGGETKSLVGNPSFGSPGRWVVKRVVGEIKSLARQFAERLGDTGFLTMMDRAFASEAETIFKRQAAVAARQTQ